MFNSHNFSIVSISRNPQVNVTEKPRFKLNNRIFLKEKSNTFILNQIFYGYLLKQAFSSLILSLKLCLQSSLKNKNSRKKFSLKKSMFNNIFTVETWLKSKTFVTCEIPLNVNFVYFSIWTQDCRSVFVFQIFNLSF